MSVRVGRTIMQKIKDAIMVHGREADGNRGAGMGGAKEDITGRHWPNTQELKGGAKKEEQKKENIRTRTIEWVIGQHGPCVSRLRNTEPEARWGEVRE